MTVQNPRSSPRGGRARKRAIRAQVARTGVAYSVAARQLEAVGLQPGETLASYGRTIYPSGHDTQRRLLVERRQRRSFEERVADTRLAAILPEGRARHLVERFPPTRGVAGSGVGPLYSGERREDLLAILYVTVAVESPGLVPETGDLVWSAEMGEETALDMDCAELDRDARRLLEQDAATLWPNLERALRESIDHQTWHLRQEATRLLSLYSSMWTPREGADGEPYIAVPPFDGVRQILDALLMVAEDGHAPGTRVRMVAKPHAECTATIVRATWAASGPPVAYHVQIDGLPATVVAQPDDLIVLADQEA